MRFILHKMGALGRDGAKCLLSADLQGTTLTGTEADASTPFVTCIS
jgi:hypothetical protein